MVFNIRKCVQGTRKGTSDIYFYSPNIRQLFTNTNKNTYFFIIFLCKLNFGQCIQKW